MKSKSELRSEVRHRLMTDTDRSKSDKAIEKLNAELTNLLKSQTGIWAAYQAVAFEPDIRPAVRGLSHISWAYPRVEGTDLAFYIPSSESTLTLNKYGILEPDPNNSSSVSIKDLSGLLVPGLAFDNHCNRLGRGAGFYDRALAKINTVKRPTRIGVALDRQVLDEELPKDSHDIPMDLVVTESRRITREERRIHE